LVVGGPPNHPSHPTIQLSNHHPGVEVRPGPLADEAAAQELALSLREAQARALRSGRDVALVIDVDTRLYRLQEDPEVQLPEGIALNVMSAGEVMASSRRPVISFAPDGGSTGGAIRLSLEDRSTTISIDWLTGAVTTASGGVNAPQT
jgi:general secretion pathway protein H